MDRHWDYELYDHEELRIEDGTIIDAAGEVIDVSEGEFNLSLGTSASQSPVLRVTEEDK